MYLYLYLYQHKISMSQSDKKGFSDTCLLACLNECVRSRLCVRVSFFKSERESGEVVIYLQVREGGNASEEFNYHCSPFPIVPSYCPFLLKLEARGSN